MKSTRNEFLNNFLSAEKQKFNKIILLSPASWDSSERSILFMFLLEKVKIIHILFLYLSLNGKKQNQNGLFSGTAVMRMAFLCLDFYELLSMNLLILICIL